MAIVQSALANGQDVSSANVSLSSVNNSNMLVLCGTLYNAGGANAVTVSDNRSNTWVLGGTGGNALAYTAGPVAAGVWVCFPTTFTSPITVTLNPAAAGCWISLALIELSNYGAGVEASGISGSGTSTAPTSNLPTTSNDCIKIGAAGFDNFGPVISAGSGSVLESGLSYTDNDSGPQSLGTVRRFASGSDTTDLLWSLTASSAWSAYSVAIRQTDLAGGNPLRRRPSFMTGGMHDLLGGMRN